MPVDVTVEEPRAGVTVVGKETNSDNIASVTNTHDIPYDRVVKVVGRITSATDHMEVVPVQMNRMLLKQITAINLTVIQTAIRKPSQVHR